MANRFVLIRQGYFILDMKDASVKKFESASEASTTCQKLNEWWENVQREGASTDWYDLYDHVSLLQEQKNIRTLQDYENVEEA